MDSTAEGNTIENMAPPPNDSDMATDTDNDVAYGYDYSSALNNSLSGFSVVLNSFHTIMLTRLDEAQ